MSYRKPAAYARKDLLTPGNYNQLGTNARVLDNAFRLEHVGTTGEHNAAFICRTMGTARLSSGPVYDLIGFDGDVSLATGHNPQVGRIILTLAAARFEKNKAPILVQNASATGVNLPTLSYAKWVSDTSVEVFSTYWNGTLGVAGSGFWELEAYGGGEDASVHVGIFGPALAAGALRDFGAPLLSNQGLRAGSYSTYVNQLIQGSADLEAALREAHAAGVHDVRPIPKAWAHVQWDGARYAIVDQACASTFDGAAISSVEAIGDGIAEVVFAGSMASGLYQTFIDVDYPRLGGAASDCFIASVPMAHQLQHSARVYFYKKALGGGGEEYFDRDGGVDFHIWLYDNHGS